MTSLVYSATWNQLVLSLSLSVYMCVEFRNIPGRRASTAETNSGTMKYHEIFKLSLRDVMSSILETASSIPASFQYHTEAYQVTTLNMGSGV